MKQDVKELAIHATLCVCLILKILSWPFVKLSEMVDKKKASKVKTSEAP